MKIMVIVVITASFTLRIKKGNKSLLFAAKLCNSDYLNAVVKNVLISALCSFSSYFFKFCSQLNRLLVLFVVFVSRNRLNETSSLPIAFSITLCHSL